MAGDGGGVDAMGELLPVDLPKMMDRSPDLEWRHCYLLFGQSGSANGSLAGEPIAVSSMRKMEHHIMVLRRSGALIMWSGALMRLQDPFRHDIRILKGTLLNGQSRAQAIRSPDRG
ncbi:hypothetical protein ACLOJK_006528, partial [Asimina triloba]